MAFAALAVANAAELSDIMLKARTDKNNPIDYKVGEQNTTLRARGYFWYTIHNPPKTAPSSIG